MTYKNNRLFIVLAVVLIGVGGFSYISKSQNKGPKIFYVEIAEKRAAAIAADKALTQAESFKLPDSIDKDLARYDYSVVTEDNFIDKIFAFTGSEKATGDHELSCLTQGYRSVTAISAVTAIAVGCIK